MIPHGEVVCKEIDLVMLLMSKINKINSTQTILMCTAMMGQWQWDQGIVIQHWEVLCKETDLVVPLMSKINQINLTQIMLMLMAMMGQWQYDQKYHH